MRELDLILNELAQGLRPMAWGMEWFAAMPQAGQVATLQQLHLHCWQAHPTEAEAAQAIRQSGLKPTHTPAVLLARGSSERWTGAVARLRPSYERPRAFRLLVELLAVADARRRAECSVFYPGGPCGHAWHRLGPTPSRGDRGPAGAD